MVSLASVIVIRTADAYIGGYALQLGIAGIWLGIAVFMVIHSTGQLQDIKEERELSGKCKRLYF